MLIAYIKAVIALALSAVIYRLKADWIKIQTNK